ncbi:hypothetical protein GCM10008967_42850 [Bacillus carboniphilus]|uniref:Uncharacterized protein n=1 Tax=Bacillus carboniphilus TaxID=86663 RepID=A0ABP3GME9_9BACI
MTKLEENQQRKCLFDITFDTYSTSLKHEIHQFDKHYFQVGGACMGKNDSIQQKMKKKENKARKATPTGNPKLNGPDRPST